MAIASVKLIDILQQTIVLLNDSEQYQWGHSGACNCGHLAQVITGYDKAQIHYWAMQKGGDWTDNSSDYCQSSGYEIDRVIEIMLGAGLQLEDIQDIENLSNPKILEHLPGGRRMLNHNQKEDVILYFRTWVDLLEQELSGTHAVSRHNWVAHPTRPGSEVMIYDSIPGDVLAGRA
jgi:hypothetical protein